MTEPPIANSLRAWRLILGLTQRELARRSGVTAGNLSHIEQGLTSPSLDTLTKIAKALNITLQQFLFSPPSPPFVPLSPPLPTVVPMLGQVYRLNAATQGLMLTTSVPVNLGALLTGAGLALSAGQLIVIAGEGIITSGALQLTPVTAQPVHVNLPQLLTLVASARLPWHLLWCPGVTAD